MPPSSEDAAPSDDSKKQKGAPGALLQRKIPHFDSGQLESDLLILDLISLSFLILNLAWLESNIFRLMEKIKFKTSATGCRVVLKELVGQALSHL